MVISEEELAQRMDRFAEVCRSSGVKITHQRLVIFSEIASTDEHPDVESVYAAVRKRMPTISLDTVYRTLWTFRDLRLIDTLGPPRDRVRFDANTTPHHHFICTECGAAHDFYSSALDNLPIPDEVTSYGLPHTALVEVRGLCLKCYGKISKEENIHE